MLSSATNFLLGVLVAGTVDAAAFGAFGLAYAIYTLALGAARALALEPLTVRFSAVSVDQWRSGVADAAGTSIVFGTVIGVVSLGVATVAGGPLNATLTVLGIALPGLLLQDAWRFSFFAANRGARAFWNDFVWAVVLFPGAAVLLSRGEASMPALMGIWAIAGWTAAFVGLAQSRIVPRPDRTLSWLREQCHLAFRFLAEFVVSSGTAQLAIFLIAGLTTLADVGHLKAGQMILGPLNILFMGAGLVAVAEASRFLAQSPKKMEEAVHIVSAVLALGTVAWTIAALLLPSSVGEAVMGSNWVGGRGVFLPLALGTTGVALSYGPVTGLRALAAARSSLRARIFDAVTTLVMSVVGAVVAGAVGAAWGYAVSGWLRVPNWWWHFYRARRAYVAPARVPTVPRTMPMPKETP
jgi:O-antigen/teichoic acid export membrane protein